MTSENVTLPIQRPLVFWHGNSFTWKYRLEDLNGTPRNTTGWQVDMDIRKELLSEVIVRFSTVNGKILLVGAPDYWIQFNLTLSDINVLRSGTYIYGIRHTYGINNSEPIYENAPLTVKEVVVRNA